MAKYLDQAGLTTVWNKMKEYVYEATSEKFENAYGIEWDVTNPSPVCKRIGNMDMHREQPILDRFRGCIHNRGVVAYYLDRYNWNSKENGQPSNLDGTDGSVGVDTGGKFWGKSFVIGNKRRVVVSPVQQDSSWTEIPRLIIDPWMCVLKKGINDATHETACVRSSDTSTYIFGTGSYTNNNQVTYQGNSDTDAFSNVNKPAVNKTRDYMRKAAWRAGGALLPYEYYKWIFRWLQAIEYANLDCQADYTTDLDANGCKQGGLGLGPTIYKSIDWEKYSHFPLLQCGSSFRMGNHSGDFTSIYSNIIPAKTFGNYTTTRTILQSFKWHGFEDTFGNLFLNLDQILFKNDGTINNGNYVSKIVYAPKHPEQIFNVQSETEIDNLKLDEYDPRVGYYSQIGIMPNLEGYIKDISLGSTGEIIPKTMGATQSTYFCDYNIIGSNTPTDAIHRIILMGGGVYRSSTAGLGCLVSVNSVAYANTTTGFRCCYLYK